VQIQTAKWGDVTTPYDDEAIADEPDFKDIGYLVSCFTGSGEGYPIDRCELEMERPDGISDFRDIQAGVNAFMGKPYPYGDPLSCTVASGGAYEPGASTAPVADTGNVANLLAVPRSARANPGDLVDVDFFVQYDGDVRTYQLSVSAGRGDTGMSLVEDLRIESDRDEFVFAGEGLIEAVDLSGKRLGGIVVVGGVDVSGIRYLGTASVRLPAMPKAQVEVNLSLDGQTFALDSDGRSIPAEARQHGEDRVHADSEDCSRLVETLSSRFGCVRTRSGRPEKRAAILLGEGQESPATRICTDAAIAMRVCNRSVSTVACPIWGIA